MSGTRMCDKSTRMWCSRIVLVFSVLAVLITMIFQVWTYYFSLVEQMDKQTIARPEVLSFLHICERVRYSWNAACAPYHSNGFRCSFQNEESSEYYVDQVGAANVTKAVSSIVVESVEGCVRLTLWALPW
ncbi:hypothetical protein N9A45_02035 [bacterium]|nr:hypothetical protein [bacterium]